MGTEKTLRFRPAVVLCVGAEGRAVGAQLASLLSEWARDGDPRRGGVALLEVGAHPAAPGATGNELAGGWMDARLDAEGRFGGPRRAGDVPLRRLIVEALRGREADADDPGRVGVLDDRVVWSIEESGYVVPRAMVVVWIVAAASSPLLLPVAEEVRRGLASERVDNWMLLALPNAYPRDPEQHAAQADACAQQSWNELLVSYQGGAPLATYAYVFETQSERGTFWEHEDDVAFAAAEAIFVLTASGITTTREYEDMLRRSTHHMVQEPFERMSGVGTSRLLFPRAQVEQFCANQLGAELLQLWARSEERDLGSAAANAEKASARAMVTEMRRQLADDASVSRDGRPSPRVSFEAASRARPLPRPAPDGGLIFRHLSRGELDRLADGRQGLPSRMAGQRDKAEEGFAIWAQAIRPGWERAERILDRTLTTTAGELVLEGPGGVARARAYLDDVRRLLVIERERLARQRESRAIAYARFLDQMELAAEGPWLVAPSRPTAVVAAPPRVVPQSAPRPGFGYATGAPMPIPFAPSALPAGTPMYQPSASYPSYSTYPPYPTYPPAATGSPGSTTGSTPGLAPGLGTGAAAGQPPTYPPGFTPVSYTAGQVPVVPWAAGDASGPWRVVYTSGPAAPGGGQYPSQNGSHYRREYTPGASRAGWGPDSGISAAPLSRPMPSSYTSDDSVPIAPDPLSDPWLPAVSVPLSDPAAPTVQRRPAATSAATSGPARLDPQTNPASAANLGTAASIPPAAPPVTYSAPISAGTSSGAFAGTFPPSLQASPLPSYLAPSTPAAPYAQPMAPAAPITPVMPMVVSAEPPTREEQLIAKLGARVRFYEARRPHPAALAGATLAALPPLVFLGQALAPANWVTHPLALLYLTLIAAGLVALAAGGYAWLRARQLGDAVEDLRAVYRRSFADRCERHEDERREAVVTGLVARVRRMVDRLSQWDTFAATMAETMQREADTVERALFDGALGRRNVLVANRRRLHPLSYRLANLEVDVSAKRRRHPLESAPWHSDLAAMLPRLRRHLRGGVSLLEADPSEVVAPIRAFCAEVVRPYLAGEIAELGAAFETLAPEEETTYLDAMMERSAILYRPTDPPRSALAFVAARDEHQTYVSGKKQPSEPITLQIEDRGWLGVLRLFPGGSLPTFGMAALARQTPVLTEPTWSSGIMNAGMGMGMGMGAPVSASFGQLPSAPLSRPLEPMPTPETLRRGRREVALSASPLADGSQAADGRQPRPPSDSTWLLDATGQPLRPRRQV